jgi:hypothetical protein
MLANVVFSRRADGELGGLKGTCETASDDAGFAAWLLPAGSGGTRKINLV